MWLVSLSLSQTILLYCTHPSYGNVRWYSTYGMTWSEANDVDILTYRSATTALLMIHQGEDHLLRVTPEHHAMTVYFLLGVRSRQCWCLGILENWRVVFLFFVVLCFFAETCWKNTAIRCCVNLQFIEVLLQRLQFFSENMSNFNTAFHPKIFHNLVF